MACSHRRTCVTIALARRAARRRRARGRVLGAGDRRRGRPQQRRHGRRAARQPPSSGARPRAGAKGADSDWSRVLGALAFMQATPPTKPVVVLLGGSAARESTISDASWRDQIVAKGGPATLAWNMGSRNRTMAQNVAVVKALPQGARRIVYIGINLGSFTSAQKTASDRPAVAGALISPASSSRTSTARRPASSPPPRRRRWSRAGSPTATRCTSATSRPAPACSRRSSRSARRAATRRCCFELPRNTAIIGSSLNAPTTKYRDKCKALADEVPRPVGQLRHRGQSCPTRTSTTSGTSWSRAAPVWQNLLSANAAKILHERRVHDGGGS